MGIHEANAAIDMGAGGGTDSRISNGQEIARESNSLSQVAELI